MNATLTLRRPIGRRTAAVACLVLGAIAGSAAAQQPTPPDLPEPGRAEYRAAVDQEKALRGTKGTARRTAQVAAGEAFARIADLADIDPDLGGRALVKAARLFESAKDRERSVACLERVLALQVASRTRAKALNLRGHAYRRAEKHPDAIKDYEAVVKKHAEIASAVVVALRWLGTCKERIGDHRGARAAWDERAERFAQRTGVVIESRDLSACSLLKEGKVADARAVLDACRARFADAAKAPGSRGRSVRRSLASMRIVKRLERHDARPAPTPAP